MVMNAQHVLMVVCTVLMLKHVIIAIMVNISIGIKLPVATHA
jgi:hypothetical protein